MGCFDNLIALKGCGSTAPLSGVFINDIGIDKKELAQYTGAQYASEKELFEAKYNLALKEIETLIHSRFQDKYKANSILSNYRVAQYKDNMKFNPVVNTDENGIRVELCSNSSYLDYYLSELSLFTSFTGNLTVKVFDLIQDLQIDTIVVPCVANQISTVYPYKIYKSERKKLNLFFAFSENTTASDSTITGACFGCGENYFKNENIRVYGGKIPVASSKIQSNFQSTGYTYGMSIVGSLNCNHVDWLCSIGNLIALPLAYLTGIHIMKHALRISPNERFNTNTGANKPLLKDRLIEYGEEYRVMMENIIQNMALPTDRLCFKCEPKVKYTNPAI